MNALMATFCESISSSFTKVVLLDKDLTEIISVRKYFTSAEVLCEVHVYRNLIKFVDEMFEKFNFKGDRKRLKMKIKSLLISILKSNSVESFETRIKIGSPK